MSFLRQLSSSKSSLAKEYLLCLTLSVLGEGIGLEKNLNFSLLSRKSFLHFVQNILCFKGNLKMSTT